MLKYAFQISPFYVIIANNLNSYHETQVLKLLSQNKKALGWTFADIRGINPTIVQHMIHLKDDAKLYCIR